MCYCKLLYFRQYQFSSNCQKRQFPQYENSSDRKFVISGIDENGENWYITNNNKFTVFF